MEENKNEILDESVKSEEKEIDETSADEKKPEKNPKGSSGSKLSGKARNSIIFTVLIILVCAACILVNILAVALTERVPWLTADITANGSFEITEDSRSIASGLNKKVKVTFLMDKYDYESMNLYTKQASNVALLLSKNSNGMIVVEYSDLVKNPSLASQYENEELTSTDVIVSCNSNYYILKKEDMFNFEYYNESYYDITSSKAEAALDTAIITVSSDTTDKIAVLTDHVSDTDTPDYLLSVLKTNNYEAVNVSLENETIPEDIKTAMIFAPIEDYSEAAALKLAEFLYNDGKFGKNLFFVAYKNKVQTPNLDKVLADYGLLVEDGLAFDMDETRLVTSDSNGYYVGIQSIFVSSLFLGGNIGESDLPVLVGYVKPITSLDDDQCVPLLSLSTKSGFCPFDADPETWDMRAAVTGDICAMAVGFRGSAEAESRIILSGSSTMFQQNYMQSQFTNQRYLLNIMATINNREITNVQIEDKVVTVYDLTIDRATARGIGFALAIVLPLIILGAGLVVSMMRRKK